MFKKLLLVYSRHPPYRCTNAQKGDGHPIPEARQGEQGMLCLKYIQKAKHQPISLYFTTLVCHPVWVGNFGDLRSANLWKMVDFEKKIGQKGC